MKADLCNSDGPEDFATVPFGARFCRDASSVGAILRQAEQDQTLQARCILSFRRTSEFSA